ncbi:MAG: polysaccharide biosynthesis/export family protein [Candidatus Sulfotelmatobacter sp.]|jgi:polysaccharide biosynthesis/export protein
MSPTRLLAVLLAGSAVCAAQADRPAAPTAALVAAPGAASPAPAAPASAAPATLVAASKPASGDFQQRTQRYRIEAGDTFDLNFDLSPEFNQLAVAVQPDGFVTLRGVGDLKVAGQTVPELTQTLRTAYSKILNEPLISVVLKEFEKPYFVADGQVAKPGKYDMHGEMTLTQAIAIAGGFQSSAKHSQVLLFRRVDDQWTEAKLIDVKKMQKNGNLSEDPFLHSGDMLFVPKNVMSKIDRFIPNLSMGSYLPLTIP